MPTGPVYSPSKKEAEKLLKTTVFNVLDVCSNRKVTSVALPAFSTGVFRFPLDNCARITAETIWNYLTNIENSNTLLRIIRIVLDDRKKSIRFANVFSKTWDKLKD